MEFLSTYPITSASIGANIIASLIAFSSPPFYEQNLFRVGEILKRGEWHRTVTSGFLHVNPTHLFLNMFVLWMFGPILENPPAMGLSGGLGQSGFLIVYFGALIGASLWMLVDKRRELNYAAVGASGAVSGIVLAFCMFYPFQMLYLFFVIPMPAIVFGAGYIVVSYMLSGRDNAMIAHGAHLGGALAGLALTILVAPEALSRFINALNGA